ncbi:hypothetical protein IAI10_10355 [Clostridium sp. 19966]|uniref:Uncharacterized protein n=2 Tax=Clostridium TaxID=1485 RepID=A0A6N2ZR79_CLOBU|nr:MULTISPECIES: DUF6133 family protein [Clostridium]EQB86609.1 hypothetical protein M918_13465 [Clostridium sp. BL8]MBP2022527.1 hypothetical protein [Clostridium punense]MDT8717060.1 hypothetical protein [Clostridium sp. 19966]
MKNLVLRTQIKAMNMVGKAKEALTSKSGEGFVDTAVKILMSVVIGALVLGGLYLLFKDTVLPTLTQKIKDMFNFKG